MGSLVIADRSRALAAASLSPLTTNSTQSSRLVFVATRWGAEFGGINSFNADLVRAVARVASNTTVVCAVEQATAAQIADASAARVKLVTADISNPDAIRAAVDAVSKSVGTDHQHWIGHDVHTGHAAILSAERFGGASSVIHHMDFQSYAGTRHGPLIADGKSQGQRRVMTAAQHRFAVGPVLGDSAHRLTGEEPHVLIPGLPDVRPTSRTTGAFQVLIAGRASRQDDVVKQVSLAIEAVGRATKQEDLTAVDWRLEIIGADVSDGYAAEASEVQGRWRGLTDAYFPHAFLPFDTDRSSLLDRIRSADLVLMPSLREGFGLIGWEAIGAGVPVVLSERSGAYVYLSEHGRGGSVLHLPVDGSGALDGISDGADIEALSALVVRACRQRRIMKERALTLRRDLLRDGHHWDDCAKQMLTVLRVPVGLSAHVRTVIERRPVIAAKEFGDPSGVAVGRETELASLAMVWRPSGAELTMFTPERVALVTGAGGLGKSTLIGHWARQFLSTDSKPDYFLAWSFRSQGTTGGTQSAELVDWILACFGRSPNVPTPFDERLDLAVELLVGAKGVLILDGLEAVQFGPSDPNAGQISDEGIASLLNRVVRLTQGTIVVGSRQTPDELAAEPFVLHIKLGNLAAGAGAALLRKRGLVGDRDELESYSDRLRGNPLALSLFAGFIQERAKGEHRAIDRFLDALGDHPDVDQVLQTYVTQWFRNDTAPDEAAFRLVRAVSLFDRPAAAFALAALREARVPGLTDADVSSDDIKVSAQRLRQAGILLDAADGALDLHPIVRGWVEPNFEREDPGSYQQAHEVLYRTLRAAGITQRDDTGSLDLLYQCLRHGVRAGLPKLVADETLGPEIRKHNQNRAVAMLGLVREELEAFGHFFRRRYDELGRARPGGELEPFDEAWVLNSTSSLLVGMGRVAEAAPIQAKVISRTERWVRNQMVALPTRAFWGPPLTNDLRGQLSTSIKNLAESFALLGETKRARDLATRALDTAVDALALTKEVEACALLTWIAMMSDRFDDANLEALKATELVLSAPEDRRGMEAVGLLASPFFPFAVEDRGLLNRLIVAGLQARGETPLRTVVLSRMNLLACALSKDEALI